MPVTNTKASVASDILDNIPDDVKKELIQKAISWLFSQIGNIFHKKAKLPPGPVDGPIDTGNGNGKDGDDTIPEPPQGNRKVSKGRLSIYKIQLQKDRFPDAPNGGLLDNPNQYQGGSKAINWGSKVWLDATFFDQDGKEFLPPAVRDLKLAFMPEIHLGGAYIKGAGPDPNNLSKPEAGYEQVSDEKVGQGITAWESTLGFVQQFKVFGEGTFECYAILNGVKTNTFNIKVS